MERPLTGVKGAPLFPLFRHQRQQPCAERVGREVVGGDEQHGVVAGRVPTMSDHFSWSMATAMVLAWPGEVFRTSNTS